MLFSYHPTAVAARQGSITFTMAAMVIFVIDEFNLNWMRLSRLKLKYQHKHKSWIAITDNRRGCRYINETM